MESHLFRISCALILLFSTFRIFISSAKTEGMPDNIGSTEELSTNYFFYQQSEYPSDCQGVQRTCSSSLNSSGVYVIKPDGYPEPFEVYCNLGTTGSGWTVIQRRIDGSVNFNRLWKDYKDGFGFPSTEFWLGNDKLSYLTNQAVNELRIDIQLSNGSSFYVTYGGFCISDEWGDYALVTLGGHDSNAGSLITTCPPNMVYGNCTCQATCEDPKGTSGCHSDCEGSEACYCPNGFLLRDGSCVQPDECPCFWSDVNMVIPNGESYVNNNCTTRGTCSEGQLTSDVDYQCSSNAQCTVKDGVRQCYCEEGFRGNGQNCEYRDCYDAYNDGRTQDGVYTVMPTDWSGPPFSVFCNMSISGGGWTVFQRRIDGTVDFYRNWTSYRDGFGTLDGEFWLGHEKLHFLTKQRNYKLRIDFVTSSGSPLHSEYSTFEIGNETGGYPVVQLGSFSGNGGYNGMSDTSGVAFSTYDRDSDGCSYNCAQEHRGAWWYSTYRNWCTYCHAYHCRHFIHGSCNSVCSRANLNGDYNGGNGKNIEFSNNGGSNNYNCNIKYADMKIRPSS